MTSSARQPERHTGEPNRGRVLGGPRTTFLAQTQTSLGCSEVRRNGGPKTSGDRSHVGRPDRLARLPSSLVELLHHDKNYTRASPVTNAVARKRTPLGSRLNDHTVRQPKPRRPQARGAEVLMITHIEFTYTEGPDWTHGYCAPTMLRAVVSALWEAAERRSTLPPFEEFAFPTTWIRATAHVVTLRANDLAPDAYDTVSEIARGLLAAGRALMGTPFASGRLDYLLVGLSEQQPDWIEPLKRRKEWLRTVYRAS